MALVLGHLPSKKELLTLKSSGVSGVLVILSDTENTQIIQQERTLFPNVWHHSYTIKKSHKQVQDWEPYKNDLDAIADIYHTQDIFIHCAAGIHRTGCNAYAILRRLGRSRKIAYDEVITLRPESADCMRFLDWAEEHLL